MAEPEPQRPGRCSQRHDAPRALRPAAVPYNDWRQVPMPVADAFQPRQPVSVVIPYFERQNALERTLAALDRQTYPCELFEVVVVDDGSRTPPSIPAGTGLDIAVIAQQRRGFGAGRARNLGARAARHDILVFLDADIVAGRRLLEAHARWHHAVTDALTLGLRTFVDAAGVDAGAIRRAGHLERLFETQGRSEPDWREPYLALTDDLAASRDGAFRAMSSCQFGIRKAFFDEVGGFDESFDRYGLEDTELAYRAQVLGALLVPVREARSWHQGRWATDRVSKRRALRSQLAKVEQLIAHPEYRASAPGRIFDVPRFVVNVPTGNGSAQAVAKTVETALCDDETDLIVRIELPQHAPAADARTLRDRFGADPRVRISAPGTALDEFPATPFHVCVPAGVGLAQGVVRRLHAKLGLAVSVAAVLDDGSRIALTRTWALHRVRRAGGRLSTYGSVRTVRLGRKRPAALRGRPAGGPATPPGRLLARIRRLLQDGARVRGARSVLLLVRWLIQQRADGVTLRRAAAGAQEPERTGR